MLATFCMGILQANYQPGFVFFFRRKIIFSCIKSSPSRTFAGRTPSCCGWEWITASPVIAKNTAENIFCEDRNQSLASLTINGSSICTCKQNQQALNPSECISLLNYTSIGSSCSPTGCLSGYRSYATGSIINCNDQYDSQGYHTSITLFETACQGLNKKLPWLRYSLFMERPWLCADIIVLIELWSEFY